MWFHSSQCAKRRTRTFQPRLEALEGRCLLSGGVLDPTFGTGGMVKTAIGSADSAAYAVATYPAVGTANDGKVVVAGYAFGHKKGPVGNEDFAVARYNLDGTPDPSFGGSGTVTTDLGTNLDVAQDVAVQPDGKVVVAGYAGSAFAVVRYNTDGSLDTSFGGTSAMGKVITQLGGKNGYDRGYSLALQPDGKIVVAGVNAVVVAGISDMDLAVVRYNADGTLDASFGSAGKAIVQFGVPVSYYGNLEYTDLAIDPGSGPLDPNAGKIVIGANLNYGSSPALSYAVARLNTNGSLDTGFGGGTGYTTFSTPNYFTSLAVQPDDRVVLAGSFVGAGTGAGPELDLARLNPDGTADATFGSGGVMLEPAPTPSYGWGGQSVALQADGKIVVAGWMGSNPNPGSNFMVARFNPANGSPDASFGNNGIAVWPVKDYDTADVALEPDGRIVVAGPTVNATNTGVFGVARFLATGPAIGSLTASPNPATTGSSLTLTAANVVALNPGSAVTQVAIYLDSNGDGILDAGDALLGYGTQTSTGTWTFTFSNTGWASGSSTLFAQAADNYGVFSDPAALTLQVL
jgi:uncharacterized delta-60 repeat protein